MNSLLQVENVVKTYGDLALFDEINFGIGENQRVALVGKNGSGKSTLLNILARKEKPDAGSVTYRNNITVGFLEQTDNFSPTDTVIQAACSGEQSSHITQENIELSARKYLTQLNIYNHDQAVSTLSGGEKKRVAIANLLAKEPDFLILDEPTNHLDLNVIEWLEDYLKRIRTTMLMVTHDRYFLDRVCEQIIEIDHRKIYKYNGNFSYFLEKREERIEQFNAEVERAQNLYRRELEWMRSTPSARTTKSQARITAFDSIEKAAKAKRQDNAIQLNIESQRLGRKVMIAKNLCKQYGEKKVINKFSFEFVAGEKVGVIGDNGSGKTTLVNMLSGDISPDSGHVSRGETLNIGYYKQNGLEFNPEKRVIDIVTEIAEYVKLADGQSLSASQFLTQFLFTPPMQQVKVRKLSGGELRRLYLLTILIRQPNLLILDEPTNDLDLMTLSVLENFLIGYKGTLLIISHDRYFLDKIADHLFIVGDQGEVKDFYGNYSDYKKSQIKTKNVEINTAEKTAEKEEKKQRILKFSFAEKRELEILTQDLEKLYTTKQQLELELAQDDLPYRQLRQLTEQIGETLNEINDKELRWLELDEKSKI